jgi:hypothetical protein
MTLTSSTLASQALEGTKTLNGTQLIVTDGLCPRISELLPGALHELVSLGAVANPIAAITSAIAGQRLDTLHIVAHGRPGAFQIGGQWVDSVSLIANAHLLAQWNVGEIALWSCEVGNDRNFVSLLEELTAANIFSTTEKLGNCQGKSIWNLKSANNNILKAQGIFYRAQLTSFNGNLALISLPFDDGFVGSNTGVNSAGSVIRLNAGNSLGWTNLQFTQDSSATANGNPIFQQQGNDIIGTVIITDAAGVEHAIGGFIKWRSPSGNNPTTVVFSASSSTILATTGSSTYTIPAGGYIGLTFANEDPSIQNGSVTGNSASQGLLDALNSALSLIPRLTIGDVTVSEGAGTATLTVSLSAASSSNVTFKYSTTNGTASAGADYTGATDQLATITAGSTSTTVTINIADDGTAEPTETFGVVLSESANASIADNTGTVSINDNDGGIATTVSIDSISVDSGLSSSDFITNDANGLTVNAALSALLATGETLEYSNDGGNNWSTVPSGSISSTSVTLTDGNLTSTNTVQFRVRGTSSTGAVASQLVTIDTTAPTAAVDITAISTDTAGASSSDFITSDTTLTISGTNGALGSGEKIQISTDGTNWVDVTQSTATTWSYNDATTRTDGTVTYQVRVVDTAGNIGTNTDSQAVTIDTTAPDAGQPPFGPLDITDETDSGANDLLTNDTNPVLSFTGEPGLTITINGPDGEPLPDGSYTVVEQPDGTYTVTLLDADPNPEGNQPFGGSDENTGDGTYTIVATDDAGNSADVDQFTIDTTPPGNQRSFGQLDITSPTDSGTDDLLTNSGNPVLTFAGEPGLTISLIGADGQTTLTQDTQYTVAYSNGTYTVTLLDAIAGGSANPFGTYNNGTTTNNPNSVADGTYTIRSTDSAGNATTVGQFAVDTAVPGIAPAFGPLDIASPTDSGADDLLTNNGNPVLTFTGEPGLTISVNGPDGYPLPAGSYSVEEFTVAGISTYKVTLIDADLSTPGAQPFGGTNPNTGDGFYTIQAIDDAGNSANVDQFQIDSDAPGTSGFGPLDITAATDSGADDLLTNNGNPILTFTGESGLTISVNGPDGNPLPAGTYSVSESPSGTYTVTLLDADIAADDNQPFGGSNPNTGDGIYTIRATDSADNVSTVGIFAIDTTAPGSAPAFGPLDIAAHTDSGSDDLTTNNGNPVLSFTGEPGLTLSINGPDGNPLPAGTYLVEEVTANGVSTYTVTLIDANLTEAGVQAFGGVDPNTGDGLYSIRARDDAGNTATVGQFTIDRSQGIGNFDIADASDTGADDNITSVGTPVVTFTGEPGLTIALIGADNTPLTQGTQYSVAYSNGTYTVTFLDADLATSGTQPFGTYNNGVATGNAANLADGPYTIQATDLADNIGTVGTIILATQGLDNDGADDTFERENDGNNDGIFDSQQRSVASFAASDGTTFTVSVQLVEQTSTTDPNTQGRLDATTSLIYQGLNGTAETTSGATISGLQRVITQDPDNVNLPEGADIVLAVSDRPSFRVIPEIVRTGNVDATLEANYRNTVNERFADTIQQVDVFFEEGDQAWNALFKPDGEGGYYFFGYNPETGLGGILLDRDNNGTVDGARLYLKDNKLGDLNQADYVIDDPVGLVAVAEAPTLRRSDDGLGLIVDGVDGTGLWLNVEALSANASWQNGLELVTSSGTKLGAVGATPNSGNLGSKEFYLAAGQELRFVQSSRNNADLSSPNLRVTAENNSFRLSLDDGGGNNDNDGNDLNLRITSSLTATNVDAVAMARLQQDTADVILDLTGIPAGGARLNFSILTDSGYTNRFGLVRLGGDALTGYTVAGVTAGNTDAFRNAVRDNLINPGGSSITAGGLTTRTISWDVTAADAGIYAAALINPNGQVFTLGGATASDGQQHAKVLGDNRFGFEDLLASQGSDWDLNDFSVQVSFA